MIPAVFLWELLEKGAETEDLVQALTQEYDVTAEDAKAHVDVFVAKLNENGLVD